jgi:DNA-binding LytR/AlgR family response regulator
MENEINILIVEDEGIVALAMEDTLESEGYHVAGIVDNGKDALELITHNEVDLVLLDIQIKGEWDGVETAERLTAVRNVPVIYLTAFSDGETVERAKHTSPAAYLVKPYQPRNLLIAIDLALHNFAYRKIHPSKVVSLVPGKQHTPYASNHGESILYFNDSIFIKQNYKFIKVRLHDIYFLEAEGNYTAIITRENKYVLRNTLNVVFEKLNLLYVIRVHRSYAVNMQHVETFNDTSVFTLGREIPLSRRYKADFLQHFDFL